MCIAILHFNFQGKQLTHLQVSSIQSHTATVPYKLHQYMLTHSLIIISHHQNDYKHRLSFLTHPQTKHTHTYKQ